MKKSLLQLYIVIATVISFAFLALILLGKQKYMLSISCIMASWLIDKFLYVCPYCHSKLTSKAKLTTSTYCGKCKRNINSGEKLTTIKKR